MKKHHLIYILAFLIYIIVNLLTIETFPFVHSDESWLAGLSFAIKKAGTFQITEPFFTLYPRQPHTIKSLFHLIQGTWITIFGYGILQVRLLSFMVSAVFLCLFYVALCKISDQSKLQDDTSLLAFLCTALVATSLQFVYASHFARQEAFLLLFMCILYFCVQKYLVNRPSPNAILTSLLASLITGLSIGFHPNSFLIACIVGMMLLYDALLNRRTLPAVTYIVCTGGIAGLYIYVSTLWNKAFLMDYGNYAKSQGISVSLLDRLTSFPAFVSKIFNQISGTYYAPDIQLEIILFIILFILSTLLLSFGWFVRHKHTPELALPLLGSLGLTIGLILIGRYNSTSIVFYIPFIGLMAFGVMHTFIQMGVPAKNSYLLLSILVIAFSVKTGMTVLQTPLESYSDYTKEITHVVDPIALQSSSSKVLINLNAGFAFNPDAFLDYRDLGILNITDLSLEAYLNSNNIEYIVLSDEMDYIYRNPDPWDILYGDMEYFPELINIVETEYDQIHTFESPQYGMRIVRYNDGYPWMVRVFKKKR